MATTINTVAGRSRLKPRREPYWLKIRAGDFLGFRRTDGPVGTWIARHRTDDGKQTYKALGEFSDLVESERFDAASKAAAEWFDHLNEGGRTEVATVADAARAYLAELRADKRNKVADHAEGQLELHVHSHRIARISLGKLRDKDIVLLCHKRNLLFTLRQHGHLGSVLSKAAAIRSRKVVMDDGTWRCVRWAAPRFVMRG